jgi:hypothetical protein
MTSNPSYALEFAGELQKKFGDKYTYEVAPGRKFDKIVQTRVGSYSNSVTAVHAFVERATGALIKAASWAQPQKDSNGILAIRYNLSVEQDYNRAVMNSDIHGGYLYISAL